MNQQELQNAFVDVTDDAIQAYLGYAKSGFIDEPDDTTTDSLVVYNLLEQDVDTDDFSETDYEYFGLIDYAELKDLMKIEFDDTHIYKVNTDLVSRMDTYYRQFGVDYRKMFKWSTTFKTFKNDQAGEIDEIYQYVAMPTSKDLKDFMETINEYVFGGYPNDTNAVDLFIENN